MNDTIRKILNSVSYRTGANFEELEFIYKLGFQQGRIDALENGLRD